jgi:hypothetical protein
MPIVRSAQDIDVEYILKQSGDRLFEDYEPNNISSRKFESLRISKDRLSIKLVDRNQRDLLSCVHGNIRTHHNTEYFEISGTYSKLERRGLLTYLFEILVYEFDFVVLSDGQHSCPGSKEFWQAQIRRKKFSIYRLNLETNFKRKAYRFRENQIWDKATNRSFTTALDDADYLITDDVELNASFEDLDDSISGLEEVNDSISLSEVLDENFNSEAESEDLNFEEIRLVAQKYVG